MPSADCVTSLSQRVDKVITNAGTSALIEMTLADFSFVKKPESEPPSNYAFERAEFTLCQARRPLPLAVSAAGAPCGAAVGRST